MSAHRNDHSRSSNCTTSRPGPHPDPSPDLDPDPKAAGLTRLTVHGPERGRTELTVIIKAPPGLIVTAQAVHGQEPVRAGGGQQSDVVVVELQLLPKAPPAAVTPRGSLPAAALDSLSPREREVLVALAAGRSNRQLAADLRVKESTVKTHVNRLLTKLALRSRTEAAAFAYQLGVVQRSDRPVWPVPDR